MGFVTLPRERLNRMSYWLRPVVVRTKFYCEQISMDERAVMEAFWKTDNSFTRVCSHLWVSYLPTTIQMLHSVA